MVDVVEVFWNARPSLERLGIKPERVASDPRAGAVIDDVRSAVIGAFPGVPTLVRIAVRTANPEGELRVVRDGTDQPEGLDALGAIIEQAVNRHEAETET
ncbi:MAG TPA: hypothetical protein VIL09_07115 [Microvirga sp.]|jgi:hypothetical protein